MASVVLVRKVITAFLHANVRWRLLPLQWVLATPLFHRVHHSADPRDYDSNFAGTFAFVDLLFGTHRRASGFPAAVGLVPVAAGAAERPASEQVEPNAVTAG
jgi:sterol desaturase/sphingolipid hydroxylase (fatty acid hydroxylase superfamily)